MSQKPSATFAAMLEDLAVRKFSEALNGASSALLFFSGTTLDRFELARHLVRDRGGAATRGPSLKCKAALSIAYGAGLRVGEVEMAARRTLRVTATFFRLSSRYSRKALIGRALSCSSRQL